MSLPVRRREVAAWSLYDFGTSAFNTLVLTFIFSRYFQEVIVGDDVRGTVLWTRAVNLSSLVVALVTPVLGAIADYSGRKKVFLAIFTVQNILFTLLLFFAGPGDAMFAFAIFVIANIGFEAAYVFYNALLPDVSTEENAGRISGLGYALGYFGGLISLMLGLGIYRGWAPPDDYLNIRATNLLVAGWVLIFSLPVFLVLRERAERRTAPVRVYVVEGFRRLGATLQHVRGFREALKAMIARMIYNDGLVTIFAIASIFAGATVGMSLEEVLVVAIFLNIAAGVGSFAGGFVTDWIGAKNTIVITLVVLIGVALFALRVDTVTDFWIVGMVVGTMIGPNQAASRSLLTNLVPEHKHGEFFGLYAFSGRLSAIFGPLLYGGVVAATGDHRLAMASMGGFFALGLLVLLFVREREGMDLARRLAAEHVAGAGDTEAAPPAR